MPSDTDPGIGIGIVVGGGTLYSGPYTASATGLCVTFERSLEILTIDNKPGAYGELVAGTCKLAWKSYQRNGWIEALIRAQNHLRRDLGMALCPTEICKEVHRLTDSIKVNQAPVAYLGITTYGSWTETGLVAGDNDDFYIELCETDLGAGVVPEQVQFSYPDDVLLAYNGPQALQAPTVTTAPSCDPEPGWRFTWPRHQLVLPQVDTTQVSDSDNYLDAVKWRVGTVVSTSAGELVGICDCDCCTSQPTITLSIADSDEGIICVDNCGSGPVQNCYCSNRRIKLNYAAGFNCDAGIDPNIEEAIVLLALAKVGRTPVKPCGCDNTWIDYMLETDPTAGTEFATKLKYGSTRAGMEVMRLVNSIANRPNYNSPGVMPGGLLTKRRLKKSRTRSILRG